MPVFVWKGLESTGRNVRGRMFSRSAQDLEKTLLSHEIALLQARPAFFARHIRPADRCKFFSQLAPLLQAQIPLYTALGICSQVISAKSVLKKALEDCAALIAEGKPLSEALRIHDLTDEFSYGLLVIGEESGSLVETIFVLVDHMNRMEEFKKKMRSALQGPLITFFFFLVITLGIFIGVIPRFELYFASLHTELPAMTKTIFTLSSFVRSWWTLGMVFVCTVTGTLGSWLARSLNFMQKWRMMALDLPVLSRIYWAFYRAQLYTMLGLLLQRGVSLGKAVRIVADAFTAPLVRDEVKSMLRGIEAGALLSDVLAHSRFSQSEINSYSVLGESSGSLAALMQKAGDRCCQRLYDTISWWIALVQPLMLVFLGLLIALLMYAVSVPLLTFSASLSG